MLKYYRQRKGLTTRQLAESVEVVPATVLMYERGQFPIPYQTAVAMAIRFFRCKYALRYRQWHDEYYVRQRQKAEPQPLFYREIWNTPVYAPNL